MNSKQLISRDIELFYNRASEETRLDTGMGVFEFYRIKLLIEKYLTKPGLTIIDVGGGTGKYAEWLAKKGHQVHLVEPVEKHLKLAQNRADKLKNTFYVYRGASQQLNFANQFADLVILHGPLYHLQKKEDRELCIREAKRVLKKDGIILGFAINYTASTVAGLFNGLLHKKPFFKMCQEELNSGIHQAPEEFPWLLAEAYYHKPEMLKREFIAQDLEYLQTYAVEGMAWLDKNFFRSISADGTSAVLNELMMITECDASLLAFSPHLMIAVKKNND